MKKRNTAGRPLKYNEDTKVVGFRIPISAEKELKEIVNNFLVKLEKNNYIFVNKLNNYE